MSLRINNNIEAMDTMRLLSMNQLTLSKAMQQLSSGKQINNASDDAAGYAISQKLMAQSTGLTTAASNAQNGISLLQTASGGINVIQTLLQRERQLAVQSANDTNTSTDRTALQAEADQINQEITQIGNTTQFNTRNLMDGTFGLTATMTGLSSINSALTNSPSTMQQNGTLALGTLAGGAYNLAITAAASPGTTSTIAAGGTQVAGATGGAVSGSTAIDDNNNGLITSLSANSVNKTVANASGVGTVGTLTTTNLTQANLAAGTWTFTITSGSGAKGTTDTASLGNGTVTFLLKDTTTAGIFNVQNGGPALPGGLSIDASGFTNFTSGGTASFTLTKNAGVNTTTSQTLTITGENGVAAGFSLTAGETFTTLINAINANTTLGVTAAVGASGLTLTNTLTNTATNIKVQGSDNALMGLGLEAPAGTSNASATNLVAANGTGAVAATAATATLAGTGSNTFASVALTNTGNVFTDAGSGFKIDLSAATTPLASGNVTLNVTNNSATLQIGANAGQTLQVSIGDMRSLALGVQGASATKALDISSTTTAAQTAITTIDAAINVVNNQAALIGAVTNRLSAAINNLNVGAENMTAAYSSITNVNMAQASTNLATANILNSSGISMLSQANQEPQSVLQLLR